MSAPAKLDLSLRQNETFEREFLFSDASGSAINLSTTTFKSEIRDQANTALPLVTAFAFLTPSASLGFVSMVLPATSSSLLVNRSYKYDLIGEDAAFTPPKVTRYLEGKISVDPATTTL